MTANTFADAARATAPYLDSWLQFKQRQHRIPGVQVALWVDGEMVLSSAHGHADVEAGIALTPHHLFRIASHSKTFTATAVMQLVESGRLRLDDTLSLHLPWTKATGIGNRTIGQLLAHGGGVIRDGLAADFWQLSTAFPDEQELQAIVSEHAEVLPGDERFKYSNIGYGLLGAVVAAASGRSYNEQVQSSIVDRLGLRDTAPEYLPARAADYAVGYSSLAYADRRVPIKHVDTRALSAATGFTSTAADVVRYFAAHLPGDDRLVSDASKRRMQKPEWPIATTEEHYGLGFALDEIDGRQAFGHAGGYPGHATRTFALPAERVVLSVFTSAIDGTPRALAAGMLKLIGIAASPAKQPVDASADRFCGRYADLWGATDIVRLGNTLLALAPTNDDPSVGPTVLGRVGTDRLKVIETSGYGSFGEQLQFSWDAAGAVTSVHGPQGNTSWPIQHMTDLIATTDGVGHGDLA
jgi:CubicO group peptidase (beta-lactamase class C family)